MNIDIEFLKAIAVEAGQMIMKIYNQDFRIEYKQDGSPVTIADRTANDFLVTQLQQAYPEIAVLSEEAKDDLSRLANEFCFIVDPLDGTRSFVKHTDEFTVNIGLVRCGKPILGVIYVPVSQKIYFAKKGAGAGRADLLTGKQTPIHVTDKLDQLIWVGSKNQYVGKERHLLAKYQNCLAEVHAINSSLKGCMIAEGSADVFYRYGYTSEWDTCAMHCIAEEAGGIFRQLDGSELVYNRIDTLNRKGFYIVNRIENIWL